MARFRYSMQSILDIKEKLETKAKQDFATANIKLTQEEEKLKELQDKREYYMEEGKRLRLEVIDVRKIRENKLAVIKTDEYILAQQKEVQKAAKQVEKQRTILTTAVQERKIHEKLKDKQFSAFLKDEQDRENKEIDELTTYIHGQKVIGERNDG